MKILSTKNYTIDDILKSFESTRSKEKDCEKSVQEIIKNVREKGDNALFSLTEKFDGVKLSSLEVCKDEILEAYENIDNNVLNALKKAKKNIGIFHKEQFVKKEKEMETQKGVFAWREFRPIEKVGLYIPGGLASYPSTVLMMGVPGKIAGCSEIVICTPVSKDGKCNKNVLVAASLCGIKKIYKVGGAQAIAAMTYGTKSIPKVYKIFGPGNQYVQTAKMLCFGEIDIDMPAGPSEIAIVADETSNSKWIAADLLSQLEHGEDSQCILVTFNKNFALSVKEELKIQISTLPRKEIAQKSFEKSFAVVVKTKEEAIEIINQYAPEHLEIITKNDQEIVSKINNAGSIFLGSYSSEALGDYATGTNHTLPTSGFAKMFQALSVESFGKMMQIQKVTEEGFENLQETVQVLAKCEGLEAHRRAIEIRKIKRLKD